MIHGRVAKDKFSLIFSIFYVFKIVIVKGEFDKQRVTKINVFIAKVVKLSLDNNYLKKRKYQ